METWCNFRRTGHRLAAGLLVLSAGTLGCGGIKTYPIEGRVTLDGKPVAAANVTLHPIGDLPMGRAATGSDGSFRIQSTTGDGLPAGEYEVSIIKQEFHPPGGNTKAAESPLDMAMGWRITNLLPRRYGNSTTSGLKVTVPSEPDAYELKLTSKK
jgi:hypothetical protein